MKTRSSTVLILLAVLVLNESSGQLAHAQETVSRISLSDALQTVVSDNPQLKAMVSYRDAAEARVSETTSDYFPRVSLSAGYTRYEENNIIVPIHKVGVFPPLDNDIYESVAQMSVPIFNGGRTRSARHASQAIVHERDAQIDLVNNNMIAAIGHIFIQAQELDDRLDLIKSRLEFLYRRYHEFTVLKKEGRVSPSEISLVQSEIENARFDSLDVESHRRELSVTLGQLLGRKEPITPHIASLPQSVHGEQATSQLSLSPTHDEMSAPEIRIAEAQLNRTEALKELSARSFWPEISGVALYNFRSGDDLDFTNEWAAGVRIQMPLFDGGRRLAGISASKASFRAAQEQLESERQKLVSKLQIERDNWQTIQIQKKHMEAAVRAKAASVDGQRELYKEGRIQLSGLLIQENELLRIQIQERVAAYREMTALINYYTMQGSLTSEHVEQLVRRLP